jgi:hypothetical protein
LAGLVAIPIIIFIGVGSPPSTIRSDLSSFESLLVGHLFQMHVVAGTLAVLGVLGTVVHSTLGRLIIGLAMVVSLGAAVSGDLIASGPGSWSTPVALVLFFPLAVALYLDSRSTVGKAGRL